ncbi:MAG: HAD hydrolase-like protein [Acholeplasmatales bacterium]|jgi:phosphoglycolate phosphatase|nr:HAD hydrolase-like protein [Acholeplasmatales bacterium]
MKYIFWDFNGTLLNDVNLCIKLLNENLREENLKEVSKNEYLNVFGFPVIEYYKKVGFDFEKTSFETLASRFTSRFTSSFSTLKVTPNAKKVLAYLKNKNYVLVILSATEEKELIKEVAYLGIDKYFKDILGIADIYAKSKLDVAKKYVLDNNINPKDCLLIGDTLHDAEVAINIGFEVILYTKGHQHKNILSGYSTIDNLKELFKIL